MKAVHMLTKSVAIALLLTLPVSCNQNNENKGLEELGEEVQDVVEVTDSIFIAERQELTDEAEKAIIIFNEKLEVFNNQLEQTNEKVSVESQEMLENLKAKKDSLESKIEQINELTKENWDEFRKELKHDLNEFDQGLESFNEDNV